MNVSLITKLLMVACPLVLFAALLMVGCRREPTGSAGDNSIDSAHQGPAKPKVDVADTRIKSEVATIRHGIASGNTGADVVEKLGNYNKRYPDTPEIVDALASVFVARQDWTAIGGLYRSVDRSLVNEELYIRSLLLSHAYSEAVAYLTQMPIRKLEDDFLLGYALYYNGDIEQAIAVLDEVIEEPEGKSADALLIRGLAAIQVADWDTADTMLSQSLEFQPNNMVAMTALARVKRKLGDEESSQRLEKLAIESRNEATSIEAKMIRMSALSLELKEAWTGRDLDKCRQIIARMMPEADTKTRAVLNEYLLRIEGLEGK